MAFKYPNFVSYVIIAKAKVISLPINLSKLHSYKKMVQIPVV